MIFPKIIYLFPNGNMSGPRLQTEREDGSGQPVDQPMRYSPKLRDTESRDSRLSAT